MIKARWSWLPWLALAVAILGLAGLGLAGPGYRLGWFGLVTALGPMLTGGAILGAAGGALALIALALNGRQSGTPGLAAGVAALAIGLTALYVPLQWLRAARSVPPIHDITTDTVSPLRFVEIAQLREKLSVPNALEFREDIAAEQRAGYPDLGPVFLPEPTAQAYQRALALVRARSWDIVAADEPGRRIEATDTTFWFGFKDDVAIRVSALPDGGSRVDVRSVSRVGRSDVGTNARRIRAFLDELAQ
jgi:hypothetical protein